MSAPALLGAIREQATKTSTVGPIFRLPGRSRYNPRMNEERRPQLYMIVESFKNRDATPVYRRFRDRGRLVPDGLNYVASWVTTDMTRCYQVMECADPLLLEQWISRWSDLVDFEVLEIIPSAQAAKQIEPRL
jgi:hypothetical protein